jgi:predicted phosphodiesterase
VKVLVLSDPHANWHALQAVLADCQGEYQQTICCGDLVGYNAQPADVLEWTRAHCSAVIRGNHDKAVAGIDDLTWFNDIAQIAARWSVEQLSEEQLQYLKALPEGPQTLEYFQVCHGSPLDEDEYITSVFEAAACFPQLEMPLTFFGHTHLQGGFFQTRGRVGTLAPVRPDRNERVVEMEPDVMYLVNPGSVGQPRDGDPRAGYALYDSEERTITLRRTEYPVAKAASDIMKAGLPEALASRLFQGS